MISDRFVEAVGVANELHLGQVRKRTKVPYLSHLLIVAGTVLQHGGDEDESIAALLHDAVEDCGGKKPMEIIRQRFGEKVATLVCQCSESDIHPKPPWRERKESYIKHLYSANASVRLISCADKLHNATSILSEYRKVGEKVWDRFNADKSETVWFYTSVVAALRASGENRSILNELELAVEELVGLAQV